jgi:hypothetical protein
MEEIDREKMRFDILMFLARKVQQQPQQKLSGDKGSPQVTLASDSSTLSHAENRPRPATDTHIQVSCQFVYLLLGLLLFTYSYISFPFLSSFILFSLSL